MNRRTLLKAIALAPFAGNACELLAHAAPPAPPIRYIRACVKFVQGPAMVRFVTENDTVPIESAVFWKALTWWEGSADGIAWRPLPEDFGSIIPSTRCLPTRML